MSSYPIETRACNLPDFDRKLIPTSRMPLHWHCQVAFGKNYPWTVNYTPIQLTAFQEQQLSPVKLMLFLAFWWRWNLLFFQHDNIRLWQNNCLVPVTYGSESRVGRSGKYFILDKNFTSPVIINSRVKWCKIRCFSAIFITFQIKICM